MNAENRVAYQGVIDPGVRFFEGEYIPVEEWEQRRPKGVTFSFTPEELASFGTIETPRSKRHVRQDPMVLDRNVVFDEETKEYIDTSGDGVYDPIDRPTKQPVKREGPFVSALILTAIATEQVVPVNGNGKVFSPNGEIRFQGQVKPVIEQPTLAEVSGR